MKAFPGWRAVGQAMRWARHQPHITADRTTLEAPTFGAHISPKSRVDNRWLIEVPVPGRQMTRTATVSLEHYHTGGHADLTVVVDGVRVHEMDVKDAARVLRILVALELIPIYFAVVARTEPRSKELLGYFLSTNGIRS